MTLLLLLLCARCARSQQETVVPKEPGRKIALLVGISDYPQDVDLAYLPGAQNDPPLIERLLIDRFGFQPEDIKILLNEEATHENIVTTFHQWLIQRADENTEALFWYSGHGSLTADRSGVGGAEHEGMDSTLVAWDSRLYAHDGAYDIIDDELSSLLHALAKKTKKITVVTDSCHSGGVTRGGTEGVVRGTAAGKRPFDWDLIEKFWPEGIDYVEDDPSDPTELPYVHIAACGPDQLAREFYPNQQTESFGGLTYFLFYRMQSLNPGDTYRDLIGSAGTWINCYLTNQSIHFLGKVDRHVFGDDYEQRPPGFTAHVTFADKEVPTKDVRLDAGEMNGLRMGTVMRLRDYNGKDLGTATISKLFPAHAIATIAGGLPAEFGARGLMATEVSRPAGQPPLKIRVSNEHLAERIEAQMNGRICVLREATGGPVHRLDVDPADAGADDDDASLSFRGPDGALIWTGLVEKERDSSWAERFIPTLEEKLKAEWQYQGMLELTRMDRGLDISCTFRAPDKSELEGFKGATDAKIRRLIADENAPLGAAEATDFVGTTIPSETQIFMLEVSNNSDEPLFFSILSVTEAREIHVIYPEEGDKLRIEARDAFPVPVQMTRPSGFEAGEPMRDRYLAVATRRQTNFHPHLQTTTLRSSPPDLEETGVPPLIANALSLRVTRGGAPPVEVEGKPSYGIATADLLVLPPEARK